jgi:tRNA 2-thiouridine synthesizing protein A
MAEQLDVRGLSCPVPVLRTRERMAEIKDGALEVLLDTDTARENLIRLAEREGWSVSGQEEATSYRLILKKG